MGGCGPWICSTIMGRGSRLVQYPVCYCVIKSYVEEGLRYKLDVFFLYIIFNGAPLATGLYRSDSSNDIHYWWTTSITKKAIHCIDIMCYSTVCHATVCIQYNHAVRATTGKLACSELHRAVRSLNFSHTPFLRLPSFSHLLRLEDVIAGPFVSVAETGRRISLL